MRISASGSPLVPYIVQRCFGVQGYKVVGIDARTEPIELTKSLKYPPDLVLNSKETSADKAREQVKALDPEKPFEGLDGEFLCPSRALFRLQGAYARFCHLTRLVATILLADPQESVDYGVAVTARHGTVVAVSQPAKGFTFQFV